MEVDTIRDYATFLGAKAQYGCDSGFSPTWMPSLLFPFQVALTEWAIKRGRSAIFADCGLGKTLMQLTWAENVVRHTGKPVLILAPLAVGFQTQIEATKLGLCIAHRREGRQAGDSIIVTNYERLHYFAASDYAGVVCDESSILKNFDGVRRSEITEFMRVVPYRLLCTATAAPNDYIELGTSSEAIGELGMMDMLSRFFKRDTKFYRIDSRGGQGWRFRGHAERDFWRWVCSWARALRRPSDLGFDDNGFVLPPLTIQEHTVRARTPRADMLFDLPAINLQEQREQLRRTIGERCEMAAALVNAHDAPAIAWCHLNDEGRMLEQMVPGSVNVEGADSDDRKESVFRDFAEGRLRVVVSKPTIAGFGLNWQHCAHQTFFPSHSYEQFYQATRRSWRFGQAREVVVDIISTESQERVLDNLKRKAAAADKMFLHLVTLMMDELRVTERPIYTRREEIPKWL